MKDKFLRREIFSLILGVLLLFYSVGYAENIDPFDDGSQYAYGENVGWLNAEPGGDGGDGVEVDDTELSGYIWAENIGWINLSPTYGGVTNDGDGNLSGYAWGENIGWINFNPTYGGVTIDANGNFDGLAWGENIGWINFNNSSIPYKVQTEWVPSIPTTSSTSSTTTPTTTPTTIPSTTTSIYECETDDDCEDDGVFCNGEEICDEEKNECVSSGDPCTDDGLFCNGEESCDEEADTCISSGNPCTEPTPICNEVTDTCTEESPPVCEFSINPASAEVVSKESMTFSLDIVEGCEDGDFEWSVESMIGSSCDQDGNYEAGINEDFFNKSTDVVNVVEQISGSSTEATVMVSWGCSLLMLYGEDSEEVEMLREFRDNVLSKSHEGQELLRLYYEWSPVIVNAMEANGKFKEDVKEMIDGILPLIEEAE